MAQDLRYRILGAEDDSVSTDPTIDYYNDGYDSPRR